MIQEGFLKAFERKEKERKRKEEINEKKKENK